MELGSVTLKTNNQHTLVCVCGSPKRTNSIPAASVVCPTIPPGRANPFFLSCHNKCPLQRQPGARAAQPRNPLHGLTLETIVTRLADFYGWDDLGQRIPIRCFTHEPSVGSSLKFLRKTPWAREKVESLYLFMLRDQKRQGF